MCVQGVASLFFREVREGLLIRCHLRRKGKSEPRGLLEVFFR